MRSAILVALALVACFAVSEARFSPLCPKRVLTTEKQRFSCFSKVIRKLYEGIYHVNPLDYEALRTTSEVFIEWMEEDIQGRSSAGAFRGVALNAEYLAVAFPTFIIFGDHSEFPNLNYFVSSNKVVSFSADFLMTNPALNKTANWTVWGYGRFSDNNLLSHYDVDFRRYGEFLEALGTTRPTQAQTQAQSNYLAAVVCNRTMPNCVGKHQQYDSWQACWEYNRVNPFILPNGQIAANCHLCRVVHSILMPFDKDLHCPHLGPSGPNNGACTATPYSDYYSFFKEGVWISNKGLMG